MNDYEKMFRIIGYWEMKQIDRGFQPFTMYEADSIRVDDIVINFVGGEFDGMSCVAPHDELEL